MRRVVLIVVAAVLVVAAGVIVVAARSGSASIATRSQFIAGTPENGQPVQLDTTLYLPGGSTPAPAVLLAHGFGGSKADLDGQARTLAKHGYVVLAYTARGFGRSGGLIHLDAPDYEVADASLLISYLATLPEVRTDAPGDPRVGVAGSSYGGGLALMLAGYDSRVDAVGADIAWNDLVQALFPNDGGPAPGVFKRLWTSQLFASGAGSPDGSAAGGPCGRFAPELCASYEAAAQTGQADPTILRLLRASSPASVLDRITAPTLLSQGQQDSLFPLTEADANARGIAAHGTPVKLIWRSGGHDGGTSPADLMGELTQWFDPVLRGVGHLDTSFDVSVPGGGISAQTGRAVDAHLTAPTPFDQRGTQSVTVSGSAQVAYAPAGGSPAAVSSVPGLGSLLSNLAAFGGVTGLSGQPGQIASFASDPLPESVLIAGASTISLDVTALDATDATLFASLQDVAPQGSGAQSAAVQPNGLVAPIRLTGLTVGATTRVDVQLPSIVRQVPAGHRLAVVVSTTDLAYQLPADPRSYRIALAGGGSSALLGVATVDAAVEQAAKPWIWLLVGVLALALAAAVGVAESIRRRRRRRAVPELAGVPIAVEDLVKDYGSYRAVDGVGFRVERGQVVGLLGPNGAGKTTVLRVLMGLISPTSGSVRVFGERVEAGAPVLSRIGAFVEGPGLLPHLSGRDNLRLYWAATGRPAADAQMDTALEIAGLGDSIERRVKTYSQGMRQRLAIAQAMLGLPELLVLDEPTNGLDPPQIAEMREVLRRYAQTGRTVIISSHLLAEVEQTCSHVVVMHKGRLVATGAVEQLAGSGATHLEVDDPQLAADVLAAAGIEARAVAGRRALEDVFLEMVGSE